MDCVPFIIYSLAGNYQSSQICHHTYSLHSVTKLYTKEFEVGSSSGVVWKYWLRDFDRIIHPSQTWHVICLQSTAYMLHPDEGQFFTLEIFAKFASLRRLVLVDPELQMSADLQPSPKLTGAVSVCQCAMKTWSTSMVEFALHRWKCVYCFSWWKLTCTSARECAASAAKYCLQCR